MAISPFASISLGGAFPLTLVQPAGSAQARENAQKFGVLGFWDATEVPSPSVESIAPAQLPRVRSSSNPRAHGRNSRCLPVELLGVLGNPGRSLYGTSTVSTVPRTCCQELIGIGMGMLGKHCGR